MGNDQLLDRSLDCRSSETWQVVEGAIWAQVLGDRSLKLKYLNPNTLFVATGSQPGQATGAERHITAHIFDTVTGQLLFSQTHEVGCHSLHQIVASV